MKKRKLGSRKILFRSLVSPTKQQNLVRAVKSGTMEEVAEAYTEAAAEYKKNVRKK